MIRFACFKSKEFIFLSSLYSAKSKLKRYISQLQTKVIRKNNYIGYFLHGRIHKEKELNRILPAVIDIDGYR